MQKEYFKILKEINSLLIKKENFQKLIEEQHNRLEFINKQRGKKELLFENNKKEKALLSQEEIKLENELIHLQQKLEQAQRNINNVTDQNQEIALNNQIQTLNEKINEIEEQVFLILEKLDECEKEIEQASNFLKGSLDSLIEIKAETEQINKEHTHEINITNQRIDALKVELPLKFNHAIENALKKKISKSIFTRINQNKCDFCKLSLSKVDEDNVEKRLELLTCQGCKRIFIPENSLY